MRSYPAAGLGFTLLEVLVVLLIMGLMVGLVSTVMLPDDRARLDIETQRLARLLELAGEQSRISGQAIAWTAQPPGYAFWQRASDSGWTLVTSSDLLRSRELPKGMAIDELRVENTPATGPLRLEFNADGTALAFTINMSLGTVHSTIAGSPIGDIVVVDHPGGRDAVSVRP